jgi:hypothetical protein
MGWSTISTKDEGAFQFGVDANVKTFLNLFAGQLGSHQKRVFHPNKTEDYHRAEEKQFA